MRPGEIFEVLGQLAVAPEPAEGTFDDPPVGQDLEPAAIVRALDDFERNAGFIQDRRRSCGALIPAVGDCAQDRGEPLPHQLQERCNHIAVLDAG